MVEKDIQIMKRKILMKNLLPVGSVVLLKDATKKLMIIGILQLKSSEKKIYDYLSVPYPEGYIGENNNFLFDHEDINDVIFMGYENPERESFMKVMETLQDKIWDDIDRR